MEEKVLKIQIPDEYEVDEEKSTFENIVLRPIRETYGTICKKLFYDGILYNINNNRYIEYTIRDKFDNLTIVSKSNCTSEKQAQKLLAINQLMNVAKYFNNGWKPNWSSNENKYFISVTKSNTFYVEFHRAFCSGIIYFKTEELARKAIKILGEETIKLALSTDW